MSETIIDYPEPCPTSVVDISVGDRIDLGGDPWADPDGDDPAVQYELAVVCEPIEFENSVCVRIGFEGLGSYGFPIEHALIVHGRTDAYDENA